MCARVTCCAGTLCLPCGQYSTLQASPSVYALVVGRLQSEEGRARYRPRSWHDIDTLR